MKCEKCGHEIVMHEELIATTGLDYEALYAEYPRRMGNQRKSAGLKMCAKKFNTKAKYDELMGAIKKYHLHCLRERMVGSPYVCQFATFVSGVWEEWKQAETPKPRLKTLEDLEASHASA